MSRDMTESLMIAADNAVEFAAANEADMLDREWDAMIEANEICVRVDADMRARFDFVDAFEVHTGITVQY